jgi:putative transposase
LWTKWLYEARVRHGLCVLDFVVTSNHVHLVVRDRGEGEVAASMQLLEGCMGQAYNRRKRRPGAFWQDRLCTTIPPFR